MTNLNLKKFQIVKDVADREEFLKLCKMYVGYDKVLEVEVSRGFTDSVQVRIRVIDENDCSSIISLVANVFDNLKRCDVSAHLDGLYSHNDLYEILMIQALLENQIEVYLSKLHEQSAVK